MSTPKKNRREMCHRVAIAVAALLTGVGLTSGFLAALVLAIGGGWWLSLPAEVSPDEGPSLGSVLISEPVAEPVVEAPAEPVAPAAVAESRPSKPRVAPAPTSAPVEVAAVEVVEERAVAEAPAPSAEDAIRAMRARVAQGQVSVADGEAGRVSVEGT